MLFLDILLDIHGVRRNNVGTPVPFRSLKLSHIGCWMGLGKGISKSLCWVWRICLSLSSHMVTHTHVCWKTFALYWDLSITHVSSPTHRCILGERETMGLVSPTVSLENTIYSNLPNTRAPHRVKWECHSLGWLNLRKLSLLGLGNNKAWLRN